jgi:AraC-like DNA-binding protein
LLPAVAPASKAPLYRALRTTAGLSLEHSRCEAGPADRPYEEQHGSFSISLVVRGVFACRSPRGHGVLGPGWLMFGNAGDAYTCSHEHGDGHGDDSVVLRFSAETYVSVQDALGRRTGPFDRACLPPLPRVTALLTSLAASGGEGLALEETALAVMAAVQQAFGGAPPAATPWDRDRAAAAARYIEAHAAAPLSLADVAGAVGLSPFHFLRSFRRAIGVTPHQYLMRIRLLRAISQLRETARAVTEVAYEAGWTDLSNFTRTFRREMGCSPREFRRRAMSGASAEAPVMTWPSDVTMTVGAGPPCRTRDSSEGCGASRGRSRRS